VPSAEFAPDVADEATIEVSDERLEPIAEASIEPVASGAPVPSAAEIDVPDFRRRTPGRATLATFVGIAAVIGVASFTWKRFAPAREQTIAVVAPAPERREPAPAPAAPSVEPVQPPAEPVTSATASSSAPTVDGGAETSPEKTANTVAVTVKIVPEEAVIFRAGQRLGTGVVEVSVDRNVKQRFTALLDGYTPSNFTVDGSRDSITIMLKRVPKRRVAPVGESVPTYGEPSEDSKPTTAPPATATPAPEATTPSAAERGVSSAESLPE
jgi:hypothetical protein